MHAYRDRLRPCLIEAVEGEENLYRCARKNCTHPDIKSRKAWRPDQIHRYCTVLKPARGIGDWLAILIARVWPWGKSCCACKRRARWLNEFGEKWGAIVLGYWQALKRKLAGAVVVSLWWRSMRAARWARFWG